MLEYIVMVAVFAAIGSMGMVTMNSQNTKES